MYYYYWAGMHAYWWIFWVIMWVLFFFMMTVRRSHWASYREIQTPLQLLQKRYAAGEITSEEYEERRTEAFAGYRGWINAISSMPMAHRGWRKRYCKLKLRRGPYLSALRHQFGDHEEKAAAKEGSV